MFRQCKGQIRDRIEASFFVLGLKRRVEQMLWAVELIMVEHIESVPQCSIGQSRRRSLPAAKKGPMGPATILLAFIRSDFQEQRLERTNGRGELFPE